MEVLTNRKFVVYWIR